MPLLKPYKDACKKEIDIPVAFFSDISLNILDNVHKTNKNRIEFDS